MSPFKGPEMRDDEYVRKMVRMMYGEEAAFREKAIKPVEDILDLKKRY